MSGAALGEQTVRSFPEAARGLLEDAQLRKNVRHATEVIQEKRRRLVEEKGDWQELRETARQIRAHVLEFLPEYLEEFERAATAAGAEVHWARDGAEARALVLELVKGTGADEVLKIKSMTTEEIGLNRWLGGAGVRVMETDLAELILQLGRGEPSHLVVPALHKNRAQVREIFAREMNLPDLDESPSALAEAARQFLRQRFLRAKVAVSGANFLLADTGGVCVVESEGNGRMCLTLPETLIVVAGIEKVLPRFADLEVMLQVLGRSATGERLNPYNSVWTGVTPGDGPKKLHIVLLNNARTEVLADAMGRQTLQCIRCGACQNACPVYRQTSGLAYGSVYAGPIGAILTPQLLQMEGGRSLPFASSLCGACYEVCPVKINIPEVLIHLRHEVTERAGWASPEKLAMKAAGAIFRSERRFRAAQRLGRMMARPLVKRERRTEGLEVLGQDATRPAGWIGWLPGYLGGWTATRDLQAMPEESFREWWERRERRA